MNEFSEPLIGGRGFKEELLRPLKFDHPIPDSDPLARHALKLLALHPQLTNFRRINFGGMDDATKRLLIQDMNSILGIRSPRQ